MTRRRRMLERLRALDRLMWRGGWGVAPEIKVARDAVDKAAGDWNRSQGARPDEATMAAAIAAYEALPESTRKRIEAEQPADEVVIDTAEAIYHLGREGACEEVHADLWQEVTDLQSLVDSAFPDNHLVRAKFAAAMERPGDDMPAYGKLAAVKAMFYRLPKEEQSRVLNGWMSWPDPRSKLVELWRSMQEDSVDRVLLLQACGSERVARWARADRKRGETKKTPAVHAVQTVALMRGVRPVEVTIKEGITRKEVIEALAASKELIEKRWDALIAERFCEVSETRSGSSESPNVPQLGGGENARVMAVPAA